MEKHICSQEKQISEITTILKGIVKEFYGNGHEGIARTVPKLQSSIETLTCTVAAQTKVISDLVEFQTSLKAVDEYKGNQVLSDRHKTTIIITIILAIGAMSCTFIINYI